VSPGAALARLSHRSGARLSLPFATPCRTEQRHAIPGELVQVDDAHEAAFTKAVDAYIAGQGMVAPEETLPKLCDGFRTPLTNELDLSSTGIANVIWATSYAFDFSLVKLPVLDREGFPIQTAGATAYPGLYFAGLPWLPVGKSGLLYGVGDNARFITGHIKERDGDFGAGPARAA